jgi:methionyl-tRNA formyltransferase
VGSFSTAGEVLVDLFSIATEVIPTDLLDYLENRHSPTPQTETLATYTWSKTNPKTTLIQKADARIDWQSSILEIYNLIRAFNPWPIAWTTLAEVARNDKLGTKGKKLKKEDLGNLIFKIHSAKLEDAHLQPQTVQVEGKNKVTWESFKNGYLE